MTQTTEEQTTSSALIVPGLGLAIDLARAEPLLLAEAVDEIAALKGEMSDAETVLREELVRRLDRSGQWTRRYRHGDVEYEVKAPSPDAGTTSYNAALLEEKLRQHVAAEEIDADAADGALERTVTVTFRVPITADSLDAVADAVKGATQVTLGGVEVEVADVSSQRKVKAAGMNALAKIPATKATVDEATVTLPSPQRKATVKAHRKSDPR